MELKESGWTVRDGKKLEKFIRLGQESYIYVGKIMSRSTKLHCTKWRLNWWTNMKWDMDMELQEQ